MGTGEIMMAWKSKIKRETARDLRQISTTAEQVLWERLRNRQIAGAKFRRQHRIGETPFVADFCCIEARLIIEVDGEIHQSQQEADLFRQGIIESLGFQFLRFSNQDIVERLDQVVLVIQTQVNDSLSAPPLPRAGEGAGG